jgi:hypothetical protein
VGGLLVMMNLSFVLLGHLGSLLGGITTPLSTNGDILRSRFGLRSNLGLDC